MEVLTHNPAVNGTSRSDAARRTSGHVTKDTTTFTAFNSTGGDDVSLTVAAEAGDRIMVHLSAKWNNEGVAGRATAATMVAGSPVTFLCSRTGTPSTAGITTWTGFSGAVTSVGPPATYVVQEADIENGQVTVQFFAKVDSATSKNMLGDVANPIDTALVNLGKG